MTRPRKPEQTQAQMSNQTRPSIGQRKAQGEKAPDEKNVLPLQMRAAFKPGTLDTEARTMEVVFGSDKPVRMYTWEYGAINEELSFDSAHVRMDRLNAGAPVLDNHDSYGSVLDTVVGVIEKAWSDGKKGYAKLRFAKTEKAEKILEMARDGILQNVSVGYAVHKYMRTKATEKDKLDHYKAVDWEPYEISMVAVPADSDAKVRSLKMADENLKIEDLETRDMGEAMVTEMETPESPIQCCTEAINEINEMIAACTANAEACPENADLYQAAKDAHKAAIDAYLEIIAAHNGQRKANTINQRKQEIAFLKARF